MPKPRSTSALIPAAARGSAALSADEQRLSDAGIDAFTKLLGGRETLAHTLAIAEGTPEIDKITTLLLDPRYETYSTARLCRLAGITAADVFRALGKASLAQAKLEAIVTEVAPALRGVVRDVMTRAQPYEIACTTCGGLTTITPEPTEKVPNPAPQVCLVCRGTGKLLCLPDLDRQKLALELGQLVTKGGGGLAIQVNQNVGEQAGSTQSGALEQLQQAMGEILFNQPAAPTAVDAEIVDPPEAP